MAAVEENAAPTAVEVPATDPSPVETDVTAAAGEAKTKEGKTKAAKAKATKPKAPKKPRAASSHPTYLEMISEAISSLKERTGSSQYAITKFVEDKHKAKLPPNFKKLVLVHLKKLTADGKLTKIKNSFKLPSTSKPRPDAKPAAAKPKKAAAKSKSAAAKPKLKSKPKSAAASKPKAKAVAKPKAPAKPKAKAVVPKLKVKAPAVKVAKKSAQDTPSKKVAVAKKVPAKVKSVKSPAKKAAVAKKAKGKASPARKVLARNAKK